MIQSFVLAWEENKAAVRAAFEAKHSEEYIDVVRAVVSMLNGSAQGPDPERIHKVDDGDYQGTLIFVIGETGYQPSRYWYVKVDYGSCSGCDTLQDIRGYGPDAPTTEQVDQYMILALHVLQGLREMA